MKLSHLVGMVIAVFALLFTNLSLQLIPWPFFGGFLVIVLVAVTAHWYRTRDTTTTPVLPRTQDDALSANEAFEQVQTYLREREGKRPLDPHEEIYDRRKAATIDGEKHVLYAVIGKEKDYEGDNKQDTVRAIWCCLHNQWWGGDDYVPGKHRRDPFYGIDRFSHTEGYRGTQPEDTETAAGTNVYVNSGLDDPEHGEQDG